MSQIQPVVMPICELCDRLTIAYLKMERLSNHELDKDGLARQIAYYETGVDPSIPRLSCLLDDLKLINGQIWDAEYDIRKGIKVALTSSGGRRKKRSINHVHKHKRLTRRRSRGRFNHNKTHKYRGRKYKK